jgi:hypothetical protein
MYVGCPVQSALMEGKMTDNNRFISDYLDDNGDPIPSDWSRDTAGKPNLTASNSPQLTSEDVLFRGSACAFGVPCDPRDGLKYY